MIRVFIGVDERAPLAYTVLQSSIVRRSSVPVQITPLILKQLPLLRTGLTQFTYSRYLVPYLCNYEGWGIFIDADMLCLTDINDVLEQAKSNGDAVSVVKNEKRFEWPSLMVFNNEKCKTLTPEYIETGKPQTMEWADSVGGLSGEYNHLVGYDEPNQNAKIIHYTQGVPCWYETEDCEFASEWKEEKESALKTCTWTDLMGNSIHAIPVLKRMLAKYELAMKKQ